jgi:hypothetical protein
MRDGNALWDCGKVGRVIRVGDQCNRVVLVKEELLSVLISCWSLLGTGVDGASYNLLCII